MIRKTIALALASMVCLTGPALAADAQNTATKAAFIKAVKASNANAIQRASATKGSAQLSGDPDFWVFLAFGLISTAVVVAAFNNDDTPVSP